MEFLLSREAATGPASLLHAVRHLLLEKLKYYLVTKSTLKSS